MVDTGITFTPNLHLTKLPANYHVWAQIMNDNLTMLDASVSGFIVYNNLRGPWTNSTTYAVGDTAVDTTSAVVYMCQFLHTSASIPTTFGQDRTTHPSYWVQYSAPATARGQWHGPGTAYALNDFVVNGLKYAVCIQSHVSTASFNADVTSGFWSILIDLGAIGTSLLPPPLGLSDANKFTLTDPTGTFYGIFSPDYALSIMGATTIGIAVLRASSQAAALAAIGAAPAVGGGYLPLSGGNLTGDLAGTTASFSSFIATVSNLRATTASAIPAGGTQNNGVTFSSTPNFAITYGSGLPTVSQARGSLYMRSDGSPYVNVDGATTWAPLGGSVSVGVLPPSSPSDGQLWYYNDASSGGGALYIRYNDGNSTAWVPASPAATPGSLVQTMFTETGAVATGTTLIPIDNTIPQQTEGDQYMSLAITPKSATSRLIIDITCVASSSVINNLVVACLFQDATANALATMMGQTTSIATSPVNIKFSHVMTSGTTSATTFKVRIGAQQAHTLTFNGAGGSGFFGGTLASSIVIQEVA